LPSRDADITLLLTDAANRFLQLSPSTPWLQSTAPTSESIATLRIALGKILVDVKDQWPLAFELALALHRSHHATTSPSYAATIPTTGYAATELKTQLTAPSIATLPSAFRLSEHSPPIVHLLHWLLRESLLLFTPSAPAAPATTSATTTSSAPTSSSSFPTSGAWDWKSKPYFPVCYYHTPIEVF
jgi:hypothetical protein